MSIRTIETAVQLKPWLPDDYAATGWDDAQIDTALTDGHDPRVIAAEIWEEYAHTLPEETGTSRPVSKWTNLDVSVEYGTSTSPRDHALRQARHHRARSKVKTVQFAKPLREGDPPEGLRAEAVEEK